METGDAQTSLNLQQWNKGDREGLDALIERNLPWIHDHVHRRMGPVLRKKGETCDYVQDAMIQFLRYGPRIDISHEARFRALLSRIVENALRNKYDWFMARRREIAQERPLPSDTILHLDPPKDRGGTPSQSAVRHEEEAWIRLGMELVNPDYREILILRKWDNLSFPEIGNQVGITAVAARMKHNRALVQLTERIHDLRCGNLNQALEDTPP